MRKQAAIFIILVIVLLIFNHFLRIHFVQDQNMTNTQMLINGEYIPSQSLFEQSWGIIKSSFYDASLNEQDWNKWKKRYKNKIKTDEDANVAINTMLSSLDDPYSRYLSKKDYADQTANIDSKISGIGVNISSVSGKIIVVGVIEKTPAALAGLQKDDIIVNVDGKDVKGMNIASVASMVRGPEGSTVELTILRGKKKLVKKIVRKEIKIDTVKSYVDKNDIGYIKIMSFIGMSTANEFTDALINTKNSKGLIIDLRGNTGGLLPNAIFIANMFIDEGPLVSIVGRNGFKRDIYAQENDLTIDKPILVLVDGGSASASEILSGALQDYHRAKLIGTKTFGKGMIQKIIPMPNETGLDLTIAKYLTPAGHDINKVGIKPDIEVKFTYNDALKRNDVQMNKAKSIMTKMIANSN